MGLSEFDQNCSLLIHRSWHNYIQPGNSMAASLVAAATAGTSSTAGGVGGAVENVARAATAAAAAAAAAAANSGDSLPYCPQQPNLIDLQKRLENPRDSVKMQALKEVLLWVMQPSVSDLAMTSGVSGSSSLGATVASRLLMPIIRFVLPSSNHRIIKLLHLYWEMVDKTCPDGSLREEMILVCNKLREDLLHPNEYVRGSTLRLLRKIRFAKILEPLVQAVLENLAHHHAYVRRNAVMCIFSMVRYFGFDLVPHATEEVQKLLLIETDLSTKRNAFLMLVHCDTERAVRYALSVQDSITGLGDIFQLALLELIRKVASEASPTAVKTESLLQIVVSLVDSCSPAVAYEGGSTLLALSSSPVALRAAGRAFVSLLTCQSDNSVRLVVLDRITEIMKRHRSAVDDFVVDVLRVLSCPSFAVRKKALGIALQLVLPNSAHSVIAMLKRELILTIEHEALLFKESSLAGQQVPAATATTKAAPNDSDQHAAYQQLLIRGIRMACNQNIEAVLPALPFLLDLLPHRKPQIATEVALLLREVITTQPSLRLLMIPKLIEVVADIPHPRVARICLYLIGEFSETAEIRGDAFDALYKALSPLPLQSEEDKEASGTAPTGGDGTTPVLSGEVSNVANDRAKQVRVSTRTVILEDGTYGTEDVIEAVSDSESAAPASTKNATSAAQVGQPTKLQQQIVAQCDFLLASMVAITMTRLVIKDFVDFTEQNVPLKRDQQIKCILAVASLLKFARTHTKCGPSGDAAVRMIQALKILTKLNDEKKLANPYFPESRKAKLREIIQLEREAPHLYYEGVDVDVIGGSVFSATAKEISPFKLRQENDDDLENEPFQPDKLIAFRQLRDDRRPAGKAGKPKTTDAAEDLALALGQTSGDQYTAVDSISQLQQKLSRVQQMTGLADPVYVEAYLRINQFDLIVELLLINRTRETLQNVNVELATHGDLNIVERPSPVTLSAGQTSTSYASIKVQSTETGTIFGHVTFDRSSSVEKEYLILNELHVDLLDFIRRSWVGELTFRTMWAEFEWENKIAISPTTLDVGTFLERLIEGTNMTTVGRYMVEKSAEQDSRRTTLRSEPWTLSMEWDEARGRQRAKQQLYEVPHLRRLIAESSSFLAVNLYSRSVFGEDALANVSIEKLPDGKLGGNIRIRSRSQGIALSLGDRMTAIQRNSMFSS